MPQTMKYILKVFVLFSFFVAAHGATEDGPEYDHMLAYFYRLAQQNPEMMRVVEYGESVAGQPLIAIRLGDQRSDSQSSRPAMLVTGVTHGHEYMNIVDQLPAWALSKQQPLKSYFDEGGLFYIVPIFNPDGYQANDRYNKNKVDLNRDFDILPINTPKLTQPETKYFADFLEREITKQNAKLHYAISYHCCGRGETGKGWGDIAELGYPWAYTKIALPENELKRYETVSEQIKKVFDNKNILIDSWANILYKAQGVASDYYYAKYGALSFVFEGMEGFEKQRIEKHFEMWRVLTEGLKASRN